MTTVSLPVVSPIEASQVRTRTGPQVRKGTREDSKFFFFFLLTQQHALKAFSSNISFDFFYSAALVSLTHFVQLLIACML